MCEADTINEKTLVRYINKKGQRHYKARIIATKGKGDNLMYNLQWRQFSYGQDKKHMTKWVKASNCERAIPELNRIQKILYKLINYFNTK